MLFRSKKYAGKKVTRDTPIRPPIVSGTLGVNAWGRQTRPTITKIIPNTFFITVIFLIVNKIVSLPFMTKESQRLTNTKIKATQDS